MLKLSVLLTFYCFILIQLISLILLVVSLYKIHKCITQNRVASLFNYNITTLQILAYTVQILSTIFWATNLNDTHKFSSSACICLNIYCNFFSSILQLYLFHVLNINTIGFDDKPQYLVGSVISAKSFHS